jgi:RNA polymerase sigma factor (sigma-70 family)
MLFSSFSSLLFRAPMDRRFPETRISAVLGVASDDPASRARAFDVLVRAYFKPVYSYVRVRHRRDPDAASELVQDFFARAFEKGHFRGFDPSRARFRTYLKGSLDHFAAQATRAEGRLKRGAGLAHVDLPFEGAERDLAASGALGAPLDPASADTLFEREWTRSLFAWALDALEALAASQGKPTYFDVFRRYLIEPELGTRDSKPSYAEVAQACGISVSDVTNYLSWARRAFRACLLGRLREITANEAELRDEARALGLGELGVNEVGPP